MTRKVLLGLVAVGAAVALATTASAEGTGDRVTGGGVLSDGSQVVRVTHGFVLHCDITLRSNNLEVSWPGNTFRLTELTSADCSDDPAVGEGPPAAGFDTFAGEGTGTLNGEAGSIIYFTFVDAGEGAVGGGILLDGGNFQIHPPNGGHPYELDGQVLGDIQAIAAGGPIIQ